MRYAESGEEEEEITEEYFKNKNKKGKKGRRNQWPKHLVDDLVDIILENGKYKEKLLLTNVKNINNGQHYSKVIAEIKERWKVREEQYVFNVAQTRQKFKRCVTMCRNAVMKVKTSSGIRRFQEDKEFGNWFAKLLPVISSMDNCQPQQAIEPGSSSPEINEADKESNIDEVNGNEASPDSASSLRHFFQGYTGFFKGGEPEASCQGRCIFKNNGCLVTTAKPCSPTSEPTNA